MAELEIHHEHEAGQDPAGKKIGILASVLAVFLAVVTIQSHRAHTESILQSTKASDQWNFYQAKKLKSHNLELGRDVISILSDERKEGAAKKLEEYKKNIQRYEKDSEKAGEDARKFEENSERAERKAMGFDVGEGLLEIGLVLTSLYFIGRKTIFPVVGVIAGIAGIVAALFGFAAQ